MSTSPSLSPETVVATYRVQAAREAEFLELLRRHWPTLRALDLVTDDPPTVYRGEEEEGGPIVFEIFTWKDGRAPETAHHTPQVARIWEAMGTLVEERGGKPKFEFPHVRRVPIAFEAV